MMTHHLALSRTVLALVLLAGTALPTPRAAAQVTLPSGNVTFLSLFADGVQIYHSEADAANPGAFVWAFTAPQANLYTDSSETVPIATHFAGPTWKSDADGSSVVGMAIKSQPSPHPDSIPELLLSAKSHSGTGIFSAVTYIQRLDTVGGNAPATLPTGLGQEFRTPYTATYSFASAVPEPGVLPMAAGTLFGGASLLLFRRRASHTQ